MAEKLTAYDPTAALVNDEKIAFFMADALETGDAAYIAHALGVATHAPREWLMWLGKPGFPTASRLLLMSEPICQLIPTCWYRCCLLPPWVRVNEPHST